MQSTSTQSLCPECDGRLTTNNGHGETVCEKCGLVVEEKAIDRGPEWRAFDAQENNQKSRVGMPTTQMLHDKGLSTTIGWQNTDAYGNSLSSRQRKKVQRLRKWNERYRTRNSTERHLKQALGEVDRVASTLGLPQPARETASVIYRRAHAKDLLIGRSIEAVATACVYAAARQEGIPRTLDEMATVARVGRQEIGRAYRIIATELGLAIEPTNPIAYLPRFSSQLDCSQAVHRQARDHLESVVGTQYTSGKRPAGLAAAALYAASYETDKRLTQQEISNVADVTRMTIREHYRELLDNG